MFGMGFTEMLFIAVIAILFLGPEKLPQAMVDIARFLKKIKGTIADTKEDLERELQISDLKAEMLSYKNQLDDMTDDVKGMSPKHMLQSEIDDINNSIKEANPMPELTKLDTYDHEEHPDEEKATKPAKVEDPYRETVTFKKKTTPITKDEPDEKEA
jgi:sec-independent protein translocase protein TatB